MPLPFQICLMMFTVSRVKCDLRTNAIKTLPDLALPAPVGACSRRMLPHHTGLLTLEIPCLFSLDISVLSTRNIFSSGFYLSGSC